MCSLIQATQRDPVPANSSQINFKPKTVFEASSLRRPRPPEDLGVQTDSQDTLAPLAESGPPLQRKALHNLSIASMQPLGNEKTEAQKLNIPYNTDWINTSLPAKDKFRTVQEVIFFLTLSINS
ncbi:hypothetical protein Bca52824_007309 [Brassica carinata]|nr:hypothetical protein Bca52824_007309 [Brassica carinata]